MQGIALEEVKIAAFILARDEVDIFLYAARHYTSFCDTVELQDMGSTDGTLDIADQFGIGVRMWDTKDKVDDRVNTHIKNTCWLGTDADWCLIVDCDELIYFPKGWKRPFDVYSAHSIPVIKPHGFEMFSETMPTTAGQIYDEIKQGAPDDLWYAKPCVFTPRLVKAMNFAPGAHQCYPELKDGTKLANPTAFSIPECYLLHYHQIGPIERIAAKYDRTRARMCQHNIDMNWGNVHKSGREHCLEKRSNIIPNLQQVIK